MFNSEIFFIKIIIIIYNIQIRCIFCYYLKNFYYLDRLLIYYLFDFYLKLKFLMLSINNNLKKIYLIKKNMNIIIIF